MECVTIDKNVANVAIRIIPRNDFFKNVNVADLYEHISMETIWNSCHRKNDETETTM